jgi:hypothetical protein
MKSTKEEKLEDEPVLMLKIELQPIGDPPGRTP